MGGAGKARQSWGEEEHAHHPGGERSRACHCRVGYLPLDTDIVLGLTLCCSKRDELDSLMTEKRIGAYVGIDPTASSLHVGHLLPLMAIFWMYLHGFHAVTLLGGATSKIGDPSGRTTDREKTPAAVRTANMVAMHYQLKKLWQNVEVAGRKYGYKFDWAMHRELVNNNAWTNKLSLLEFLQVLGPGMRMGTMLGRDT